MTSFIFPGIVANLFDANEICSFCGSKLIPVDRVEGKLATACVNRNCQFRYCLCVENLKKGIETAECPVHWRCACREGYLCGRHQLRPKLVLSRYKLKGKEWSDASGFSIIKEQANLWIEACEKQEKKALAHCGNCFSPLVATKVNSPNVPNSKCSEGCKCECAAKKACHVHLTCGCVTGHELCKYHLTKKPDILVKLSRALPPTGQMRTKLIEKLNRAGITLAKYPQRGRVSKELDIRELVLQSGLEIKKPEPMPPLVVLARLRPVESQVKVVEQAEEKLSLVRPVKVRTSKPLKPTRFDLVSYLASKMPEYKDWLGKQGLSHHSVRNYVSRINGFITILQKLESNYPPLSADTKDLAVRDLKKYLKKDAKVKPATLNSYLAAVDSLYGFLGLGKTEVVFEDLPQEAPQALKPKEQKKFLRAVELTRRKKDRAIATLLFYTGIRLSECAKLELDDVFVVGRNPRVIIREGKGDRYRVVPLNSVACEVIQAWLGERKDQSVGRSITSAVFLNPQGKQLMPNSIYEVIRKIGRDAGLELSPHTLRHTCLTSLVRKQNDVILVADIAGHRSLNTTRRYTLPNAADKAKALEDLIE